jgi:hypothetical protein
LRDKLVEYLRVQAEHRRLQLLYNQYTVSNNAAQVPFSSFNIGRVLVEFSKNLEKQELQVHPKGGFTDTKNTEVLVCYIVDSGDIAAK